MSKQQSNRHVAKMYGTPPDPHVVASLRDGGLAQTLHPKLVALLEQHSARAPAALATLVLDLVETELRLSGVNLDDQVDDQP